MAERKLAANSYFLFLGTTEDSLSECVCIESHSGTNSTNNIDSTTFCGADNTPGTQTSSKSMSIQRMLDPDGNKISGFQLFGWWKEKTDPLYYQIAPAVPVAGDEIETGTCYVSQYNEEFGLNANGKATITLQVHGTPTKTIYSGS